MKDQYDSELRSLDSKIYIVRGLRVMLDSDLAELYDIPTIRLNQQVRRNHYRFPSDFMFPLTNQELAGLKSQIVISKAGRGGRRSLPLAFTEQGIAMLSSVLNSRRAIEVNIAIMRTFVQMKRVLISNADLEKKINDLESKYDGQFQAVFDAIYNLIGKPGISQKKIIGLGEKDSN